MSLVAAAVCPHPPMIVPELAGGAAGELDGLRAACDAAVAGLVAAGARTVLVVGSAARTVRYLPPLRGSFAPWGVPLRVAVAPSDPDPARPDDPADGTDPGNRADPADPTDLGDPGDAGPLPLSLLVGAWLLGRAAPRAAGAVRMVGVAADAAPAECAALGGRLAPPGPWALLVMGDGSACRGRQAPGYDDPRAVGYDTAVARALAEADPDALLDLDPRLSAELLAAGRAPWQALAGAVRAAGGRWRGELRYDQAPYGVSYFVASWRPA